MLAALRPGRNDRELESMNVELLEPQADRQCHNLGPCAELCHVWDKEINRPISQPDSASPTHVENVIPSSQTPSPFCNFAKKLQASD